MRSIGIHLRIDQTLTQTALQARALGMRSFQCFVTLHASGKCFVPDTADIKSFNSLRSYFDDLFLHASYAINPANTARWDHPILEREISMANRLHIRYLVLHPGMVTSQDLISQGIDALARVIDMVHASQDTVSLVIENTAQETRAVGSNFAHLKMLLERVDDPSRLRFCVDTAHAYAYGYNISEPLFHERMLDIIDDSIGIKRVVLIHLNDTLRPLASYIDEHTYLGKGCIGIDALQAFVNNKRIAHIPLIMELPLLAEDEYRRIFAMVSSW